MPTLLLVRHGRTTANTAGVLAGWTPGVRLDEQGEAQVAALGQRAAVLPIAQVVTSPLERCGQTAAALTAVPGPKGAARPEPVVDDRLGECRYGDWTGREPEDAREGAHVAGGAAAPERRGVPRSRGRVDAGDAGPRARRRPRVGRPRRRRARAGRRLGGGLARRRDQGDPGRRAGQPPRPVPAHRGLAGVRLGGAVHADPPLRRAGQRRRRRPVRAGAAAAQGTPGPCPESPDGRRGRRRRRVVGSAHARLRVRPPRALRGGDRRRPRRPDLLPAGRAGAARHQRRPGEAAGAGAR
nr:histidine phosphatase family protein [Angustibacter aerolatus]